MNGTDTAFELAWEGWLKFKHGHSIGDPPPPKLWQAVLLFEGEVKAREALQVEASELRRKREEQKQKHKGKQLVIVGGKPK